MMNCLKVYTFAVALAMAESLLASNAEAAVVTFDFIGTTKRHIADTTNYFGLGTSIEPGQNYTLTVRYDDAIGSSGGFPIPRSGPSELRVSTSDSSASLPTFALPTSVGPVIDGPTHITSLELTFNNNTLSIDGSEFSSHVSGTLVHSYTRSVRFGCLPPGQTFVVGCDSIDTTAYRGLSMGGGSSEGSKIAVRFDSSLQAFGTTGPFLPPFNPKPFIRGSLSLLLLGSDSQPLINIQAFEAFGAIGQAADVPLPAALPLFAAGVTILAGMARRRMAANE